MHGRCDDRGAEARRASAWVQRMRQVAPGVCRALEALASGTRLVSFAGTMGDTEGVI
jgi:hypothetical protein